MNIIKKPFYLIFSVAVVGLTVANIFTSASLSTYGAQIKELEQEKAQLADHNRQLEQKILQKSSLTYLEQKAQENGFEKPQQVIAITTPAPVALSN